VSSIFVYKYTQQMSTHQYMMQYARFNSVINYISEHQLSHAVKCITYYTYHTCQLGSYIIKIALWRHCLCFNWLPYILGRTTAQSPGVKSGRTAIYSIHEQYRQHGMSVISRNLAVEPSFGYLMS